MDAKFQQLISRSQVTVAIVRTPGPEWFMLCDLSTSTLADLVAREDFVGVIGLVGLKPQAAFAVELTGAELSTILASFLRLFERALIRVESSLTGMDENLVAKFHQLPPPEHFNKGELK